MTSPNPMMEIFSKEPSHETPPMWFMRQAGRYLSEYRRLRKRQADFVRFCLTPKLATEAALQPLKRFDLDAAILFSDILLIPHALGQNVRFEEGVGPLLDPLFDGTRKRDVPLSLQTLSLLDPVYEAVERTKEKIPPSVSLIGFAGAPWTVASYMITGKSEEGQKTALQFMKRFPEDFEKILDILLAATERHLKKQIEAGADIIQIFESFAGSLPPAQLRRFSLEPILKLAENIKRAHPSTPIIVFPKNAAALYKDYLQSAFIDAVSIDENLSLSWAAERLQPLGIVQGSLAPQLLQKGGRAMLRRADEILDFLSQKTSHKKKHIFSLGHGILPDTPPSHLARLIDHVRKRKI